MIGASRETVSRTMREFQDAGLLTVSHRRITIQDRPGLEARAQARPGAMPTDDADEDDDL
jgi:hypothetical protein